MLNRRLIVNSIEFTTLAKYLASDAQIMIVSNSNFNCNICIYVSPEIILKNHEKLGENSYL